jgi:solute:Na+ symporter, SSS family
MFTTWATPRAGFWGLLLGTLSSIAHNLAYRMHWISYGSDMSANFYGAIFAFMSCLATTTILSALAPARSVEAVVDLTYWTRANRGNQIPKITVVLAFVAITICLYLSILFR